MWRGLPLVVEPTHLKECFSDQVGSSPQKNPKLNKKNLWSFTNTNLVKTLIFHFRIFFLSGFLCIPTHPNTSNQLPTGYQHRCLDFHFQLLSYHLTIQEATPPWRRRRWYPWGGLAAENGPGWKMYFLLKNGDNPAIAMLVYQMGI